MTGNYEGDGSLRLGFNVDHVATLRNARGGAWPDPIEAAQLALAAGADGITAHLREDRRHIRDDDMRRLRDEIAKPLNFEMAVTTQMLEKAKILAPHACCLVPENRQERTTEGGLDVLSHRPTIQDFIARLKDYGIRVSLFIEPDPAIVEVSASLGADAVELHTGAWREAVDGRDIRLEAHEFHRLQAAAKVAVEAGLDCHAGHGLDYRTARRISALPEISELNIGHFLVGQAIFVGIDAAIKRMKCEMEEGRQGA